MASPPAVVAASSATISPPNNASSSAGYFNYGTRAAALVRDLERTLIPLYDHDGVRQVLDECEHLNRSFTSLCEELGEDHLDDPTVRTTLSLYAISIRRNKRCLLVYLQTRWDRIVQLMWERAGAFPPELVPRLAPSEVSLLSQYQNLIAGMQQNLDLVVLADLQPPKDLFIEVRVVQPAGEILTSSGGSLALNQGSTLFVRRSEVETLLRCQSLKQL
jgi:GINS complex subunit 1